MRMGRKDKLRFDALSGKISLILVIYLLLLLFLSGVLSERPPFHKKTTTTLASNATAIKLESLQEEVLPANGYIVKIRWGDLGKRMVDDGVIDKTKFARVLSGGEKLPADFEKYLNGSDVDQIEVNAASAQFWVDVFWALGLANRNDILEKGQMAEGGNTANFASTGGWTIGGKSPMQIYSGYNYINLTHKQQALVEEIAAGVYRPCCNNPTAFPDCNHGMAALGLIELMVAQGFSEDEIFKTLLSFNSFWFPQTYLDIAYYFTKNGRDYLKVPAKEILSKSFSSAQGYQTVKKQIGDIPWPILKSGGSCGA